MDVQHVSATAIRVIHRSDTASAVHIAGAGGMIITLGLVLVYIDVELKEILPQEFLNKLVFIAY